MCCDETYLIRLGSEVDAVTPWVTRERGCSAQAWIRVALDGTTKTALACWLLPPYYKRSLLHREILQPLGVQEDQTVGWLGWQLGHCGAVNQIVALEHLIRYRLVEPGDQALVLGLDVGLDPVSVVASGPVGKVQA